MVFHSMVGKKSLMEEGDVKKMSFGRHHGHLVSEHLTRPHRLPHE